ncbi:unnamed protein product, partial [Adineta steineri]
EELEDFRSNQRKQIEQIQSQMEENEVRYKTDLSRIKSKLQNELVETRIRYDALKKSRGDLENQIKKLQNNLKDAQDRLIEEQTTHSATRDLLSGSEKRFGLFHSEIEELRSFLDRSEKARKTTELELHDSEQRLSEASTLANRAIGERKKFEADAMQYHGEISGVRQELKSAEERVRKLAAELIHRDEEIRHEREKTA